MNPTLLLRIVVVRFCSIEWCHTLGMPWTPSVKPQDIAVLEAMKANHFEVAGSAIIEANRTSILILAWPSQSIFLRSSSRALAAGGLGK